MLRSLEHFNGGNIPVDTGCAQIICELKTYPSVA